jgi:hypothetical protein
MTIVYSHYGVLGKTIDYLEPSYLGLRVYFTETMYDDSVLNNTATYAIAPTGSGVSVTVLSVTPEAGGTPIYVDLVVTDCTHGEEYELTLPSGTLQDSGQTKFFTSGLTETYNGVSVAPNITGLTTPLFDRVTVTFSKAMTPNATLLSPASYVFDGGLTVSAVEITSSTVVTLTTSFQQPITYNLVASTSLIDLWLNTIGINTGSVEGNYVDPTVPVAPPPASVSEQLSNSDKALLAGFPDIQQEEPEQIFPEPVVLIEEKKVGATQRLTNTRSFAKKILDRIKEQEQLIDRKCSRFKVATNEERGSPLFQAMVRVFEERTTTITYDHYKKAIELRARLVEEDSETLKKDSSFQL